MKRNLKYFLVSFIIFSLFTACTKVDTDNTSVPEPPIQTELPKPEGMSDAQYQNELRIIRETKATIETTTEGFPYQAYLDLGLHSETMQDYATAEECYQKVLETDETNYFALNNLAVVYERLGEKQKALELYAKLSDAYAESWEPLSDALRLFKELDRAEDGTKVLEHFIQNYPEEKRDADFQKLISEKFKYLNDKE